MFVPLWQPNCFLLLHFWGVLMSSILIQIPCGPWITECQPLIYFDHKFLGRYVTLSCLQMDGWLLLNTGIVPYHAGVSWRTKTRDFCSTSALFHLRISCVNQSLFLSRIHTNPSELISSNSSSNMTVWANFDLVHNAKPMGADNNSLRWKTY